MKIIKNLFFYFLLISVISIKSDIEETYGQPRYSRTPEYVYREKNKPEQQSAVKKKEETLGIDWWPF